MCLDFIGCELLGEVESLRDRVEKFTQILEDISNSPCRCAVKLSRRMGSKYVADPSYHEDDCVVGKAKQALAC
jgi:hypothetical protein